MIRRAGENGPPKYIDYKSIKYEIYPPLYEAYLNDYETFVHDVMNNKLGLQEIGLIYIFAYLKEQKGIGVFTIQKFIESQEIQHYPIGVYISCLQELEGKGFICRL